MTGSEICATIISIVKETINSEEFRQKFRIGNCFTRVRKLTMGIVMMFLLSSRKKSLPNEIDDFLNAFGAAINNLVRIPVASFTKQAISKARKGIKLDAFFWLLDMSVSTYFDSQPSHGLWNGLHLFAIDGTDVQLPMLRQGQHHVLGLAGALHLRTAPGCHIFRCDQCRGSRKHGRELSRMRGNRQKCRNRIRAGPHNPTLD